MAKQVKSRALDPDERLLISLDALADRLALRRAVHDWDGCVSELRDLANGRDDLLAERAGITLGFTQPGDLTYDINERTGRLFLDAGADRELACCWVDVGRDRRRRAGPPYAR